MTLFYDMKQVFNYGCYCQLVTEDGIREAVGAPMDGIDIWHEWHSFMDCLTIDHQCVHTQITYEASKDGNGDVTCVNQANNDCATNACWVCFNSTN